MRTFAVDVLRCAVCHEKVRVVAVLRTPAVATGSSVTSGHGFCPVGFPRRCAAIPVSAGRCAGGLDVGDFGSCSC